MTEPSTSVEGEHVAASIEGAGLIGGSAYVAATDTLAGIHGYEAGTDLVGRSWDTFYTPELDCTAEELLSRVRREGTWRGAALAHTRDGDAVPVELSMRAIGDRIVCIVGEQPVAPREEGRQPDEWNRQLVDAVPGPTAIVDAVPGPTAIVDAVPGPTAIVDAVPGPTAIVDAVPGPTAIVDADGSIVHCNEPAVAMLGAADQGAIVGHSACDLVHEDDRDRFGSVVNRSAEGYPVTDPAEHRLVGLDGQQRVVTVTSAPTTYEGHAATLVFLEEVPDAGHTGDRRGTDRRFIGPPLDALDDLLYVVDSDGELVDWNAPLVERFGYGDEELAGVAFAELLAEEHRGQLSNGESRLVDRPAETREVELVTNDGERIPHELRGVTYTDSRSGERYRIGIACDITERKQRERELERCETIIETVDDGVYSLDGEFRFDFVNEPLCEMLGLSNEDLLGTPVTDLFDYDVEATLESEIREGLLAGDTSTGIIEAASEREDGEIVHTETRLRFQPAPDGEEFKGAVGVLRDITDRKERQRMVERQRDELDTLNRINELLLTVTRDLFERTANGSIEETVCSGLVDSNLYQFAWIGKPDVDGDRLLPDACAGVDEEYVGSILVTGDRAENGPRLEEQTFRTGTMQVSQDVSTVPTVDSGDDLPTGRTVRSAAAVPLTYDGTTYGVLAVYADRPLAFSHSERRSLEILGEAVGFAIHARNTWELLFADQVVELEFRVGGSDWFLTDAAEQVGCELSLVGYAATVEGSWLVYFSVPVAEADRFVSLASERAAVETAKRMGTVQDEQVVGLTMQSRFLDAVADLGGKVTSGTLDAGAARIAVEIPQSTDVGEFVEQLRGVASEVRLLAQRTRESPTERLDWFPRDAPVDLTDRQFQALEAANHAGYFEWPRESSAEDVAELLEVSRPTLQAHLRKAERELVATFLADSR